MKKLLLSSVSLLFLACGTAFAQPANDNCATAQNLGTITAPACPPGSSTTIFGVPTTFNGLTNVGATPSNPYPFLNGCVGGATVNPALDVWYLVTVAGTQLTVSVTGLQTPNVALWQGTCGNFTGRGCARAANGAGSVVGTFAGLTSGTTYLLQISGGNLVDEGSFNLSLNAGRECLPCAGPLSLTVSPQPSPDGTYPPNTPVTFSLTVNGWNKRGGNQAQGGSNWFHGLEFDVVGTGWNIASVVPVSPPSCDGVGTWAYFPGGVISGVQYGPGFYYDSRIPNPPPAALDGNPVNNFGDGGACCYPSYFLYPGAGACPGGGCGACASTANIWTFQWTITTSTCPPAADGDNLSFVLNTLTDLELYNGGSPSSCSDDPSLTFNASIACCAQPTVATTNVSCFNAANGTLTVTADLATTGPYDYEVYTYTAFANAQPAAQTLTGQVAAGTFTGLAPGNYIVRASNAQGCSRTRTFTITQPATSVSVTATTQAATCFGALDGTATATGSGGTGPYTYAWSNGQNGATATNLPAGAATVTVTDANNCTASVSVTIAQPVQLSPTITQTNVTCNGAADGTATANLANGQGGTLSYAWSNAAVTQTVTGLAPGTYFVTVTETGVNGNGRNYACTGTATVTITQPLPLVVQSIVQDSVDCNGGLDGSLFCVAFGGFGSYNFSWADGQVTQIANNLAPGNYCVTVTDANGCTATDCADVFEPAGISFGLDETNPLCNGQSNGSVCLQNLLGGTPGFSFIWSTGGTGICINNQAAGSFQVTVTDANGCTASASTLLGNPPTITAVINVGNVVNASCNGFCDGQLTVTPGGGVGGYSILWSNGQNTATATGLCAGPHSVTVTDANGCSVSAQRTITQPTVLNATASKGNINGADVSCPGAADGNATATGSGGTAPYTFLWTTGATTATITGLVAGNYCVTATDANGCTSIACVTLNNPPQLTITAIAQTPYNGQNISCFGASDGRINTTVTGGTGAIAYAWAPTGAGANPTLLPFGIYTVTATDVNGCTNTATATLNQPAQLSATFTVDASPLCFGQCTGQATVSPTGGTAPFVYTWSGGQNGQTATNLCAGTYSVTVNDANGCSFVVPAITIVAPAFLSVSASTTTNYNGQTISCFGAADGGATATTVGGAGNFTFLWSTGAATQSVSNLANGNVCVTATDQNGCSASACVTLVQPTAVNPNASVTANASCFNTCDAAVISAPTGGTPGYVFAWDTGDVTAAVANLCPGTYTVTVTDANNCTVSTTVTPTAPPALNVTATALTPYNGQNISCFGAADGQIQTNVNGGTPNYTYAWAPNGTGANPTGLAAGIYTVTVTDAAGCTQTASATLVAPTVLSATATIVASPLCFGQCTGQATANPTGGTAPFSFAWSNGQNTQTATNLCAGTYSVTVTDANGCTFALSNITITAPASLSVTASTTTNYNGQTISCFGAADGGATATPVGGAGNFTFLWSTGAATQSVSNLANGNVCVTATDQNGCSASACVTLVQPTVVNPNASVTANASCFNTCDAAVISAPNGGTPGYLFAWSTGDVTAAVANLCPGTYTVTVTDANNCTASTSVTPAAPPALNVTATALTPYNGQNISCFGAADGQIQTNVNGGTPNYTYAWAPNGTGANPTGLAAGIYTVTVTDVAGCTQTATATLVAPPVLGATATIVASPLCFGQCTGQATVNPTGGTAPFNFIWSDGQNGQTATNLCAGTYSVTVTDANGCTFALPNVTIVEPTLLNAAANTTTNYNGQPISCFGAADGGATVIPGGGAGGFVYLWANGATDQSINNLVAGNYCVTVTDLNGCTASTCVNLSQPAQLQPGTSVTANASCFNTCDAAILSTPTGGTPGYLFAWSTGDVTAAVSNLCPNTYTVTVTDANNCTATSNITPSAPPALTLTATALTPYNGQNISCFGLNDGQIQTTVGGGTPNYTYTWLPSGAGPNPNNLVAGIYTLTVTDASNCTITATATLTEPTQLSATATVDNDATCFGNCDGRATVTAGGGTPGYAYLWSNGTTNATATGLCAGNYSVTVIDANNCNANVQNIIIGQPAPLSVATSVNTNYNGADISCFGGSDGGALATGNGGIFPYTFAWSNGATDNPALNLNANTYCVTISDANGCTSSSCVTLNNPPQLSLSTVVLANASCAGQCDGSLEATATGGVGPYGYVWSNGQNTATATGLCANVYTVTATDVNGCTVLDFNTVAEPPVLLVTATPDVPFNGQNISCFGASDGSISTTTVGGNGGYSYSWSPTGTGPNPNGLPAGTYSVTVTDISGCQATATATLTEPAALSVSALITSNILCAGQCNGQIVATPAGGTPAFAFLWSNGQTGATATGLCAGTYSLTITDANGCTASTGNLTIVEPAPLNATTAVTSNFNGRDVSCFGANDGSASVTPTGGTGPFNFVWNNGANGNAIANLLAGTYCVTVTDANGCTASSCVTLVNPPALTVSAQITASPLCFGDCTGAISASPSGGTAPYTFVWSNGGNLNSISNLCAGTYSVTVTDVNNCTVSASVTIVAPALLVVTATPNTAFNGQNISCFGASDGSIATALTGGTGPAFNYTWLPTGIGANPNGLAAGAYTVTVTDANNCSATTTATLTQPAQLTVTTVIDAQPLCFGQCNGQITATPAGGTGLYTILWSNNANTAINANLCANTYGVTVTDANACTAQSNNLTIAEPPQLTATASVTTNYNGSEVSCVGAADGAVTVTPTGGTPNYTYLWNVGGQTTQSVSGLPAGTYVVTVTDGNNCTITASVTVDNPPALLVNAGDNQSVSAGTFVGLGGAPTASGGTPGYTYSWSNGETTSNPVTGFPNPGQFSFTVTVTDANGCTGTDVVVITVSCSGTFLLSSFIENENCGLSDGNILLNVGNNNADFTYTWSGGTPIVPVGNGITNVAAGVYSVTVAQTGTNCTLVETFTVGTANAQFIAGIAATPASCGQTNGSATVIISPAVANPTITWSVFGGNGATLANLAAGTYTVTVTDGSLCSDIATVVVAQQASFTLSVSNISPATCNGNDGGAFLTTTGAFANPLTYAWSDNTFINANVRNNLAAGTVSVTVTDAIGCTASLTFSVPNAGVPNSSVTIVSVQDESCPGANDGQINFTVNYGGTAFPLDTVITSGLAILPNGSLTPGSYCVEIYDTTGCLVAAACDVVEAALPLQIVLDELSVTCFGLDNGSATAVVSGGTAPLSYIWDATPGIPTVNNLTPGGHVLLVSDVNGCNVSGSFTILEPPVLTQNITEDISLDCNGDCDGQLSVAVTGGTPDLFGNYTYLWSNNAVNDTIVNLCAGNYGLTVTDATGCTVNTSYLLGEPALLQAQATASDALCFGDSTGSVNLSVIGGTQPYAFAWDYNGATSEDLTGVPDGTYTVTITDFNGCTATAQAVVGEPLAIAIALDTVIDEPCAGGNSGAIDINVTGGTPQFFFTWLGPTGLIYTSEDLSGLIAGDYNLTVTDANGCQETFVQNVAEPDSIQLFEFPVNPSCNAVNGVPNGQITVVAAGGTGGPYTIQWTPNAGNSTDFTVLNLPQGSYGYVVTDASGCTVNGVVFLTQPDSIDYAFSNIIPVLCFGQATGRATVTASGANGNNFDYIWSSGEIGQDLFAHTAVQLPVGIAQVTVTENITGCFIVLDVPIAGPTQPISLANGIVINNPDCVDGTDGSISVTPTGGTSPYNFQWLDASGNPVGGLLLAQPTATLQNLPAGTYGISVTDANGCPGPIVVSLVVTDPDTFLIDSISIVDVGCYGQSTGSATIFSTTGGTAALVAWSNGQFGITVNDLPSGSYTVTVTSTVGCIDSASFDIGQPDTGVIAPPAVGDTVRCFGESNGTITIDTSADQGGLAPYLYSLDGEIFQLVDTFSGLASGYYMLYVQDANGCIDSSEIYVDSPEPIEIATVPNYVRIGLGETVEATVQLFFTPDYPPITYQWTPSDSINCDTCPTVELYPVADTRYIVTVQDSNGCFDTAHVYVNVDPNRNVFIPTAFTPNGDGLNDVFMLYGGDGVREVLNFQVFDRWGEQIYSAANFPPTDPAFGWNGQFKGKVLNPGSFIYYFEVEYIDGRVFSYKGDVTIIR